jgi:hypothetical protein
MFTAEESRDEWRRTWHVRLRNSYEQERMTRKKMTCSILKQEKMKFICLFLGIDDGNCDSLYDPKVFKGNVHDYLT